MAVFPACQPCTNTVGFLSLASNASVIASYYFIVCRSNFFLHRFCFLGSLFDIACSDVNFRRLAVTINYIVSVLLNCCCHGLNRFELCVLV